jgi:hemolysin activation/secretion protein
MEDDKQGQRMKAWIGPAIGMSLVMSVQAQAQFRPPTTANPLQNLPRVETPNAPRVNTQVQTQAANPRLAALLATQITPQRFDVTGVHAVPFKEIAALFTPMRGKTVTVGDVLAAAAKITVVYKAHGYALSFGYVPTQNFADGTVHVTVVEGYVADVVVKGDAGNMERKIRAIAAHIVKDRPLRQKTFERYLQVLGMLPGIRVNANVPAPTTTDGATRLVIDVTRTRFNATTGVDVNHPGVQGLTAVTENGFTPLSEQLTFSTLLPSGPGDQRLYSLAYMQPVGADGLMLHLSGSHYQGNPDTDNQLPSYLQQNMEQDQYAINLAYPLLLDSRTNLTLTGGAYATDLQERYTNTVTGASVLQQYDLRVLDAKLDYVKAHDNSTQKIDLEISHGLNALGASASVVTQVGNNVLVTPANAEFTRYDATFIQSNAWPQRFGTVFNITGQHSNDTLPTTEQISFGVTSWRTDARRRRALRAVPCRWRPCGHPCARSR